jgi:DNA-binding transcriptional ArsR family regulator
MSATLPGMDVTDDTVRVGKALGDPTRAQLLVCLAERELCVCGLVHLVSVGQPAVSRHLRILREAGLLEDVRDGQYVNYRLRRPARTAMGEAALEALLKGYRTDPRLLGVTERAQLVSRECL